MKNLHLFTSFASYRLLLQVTNIKRISNFTAMFNFNFITMSRTTFSILFYLKRSKLNKKDEAPIYMRITIDGERSETSIKRSIDPDRWNSAKGMARSLSKVEKDLNLYLKQITHQVYLKQQEIEGKNRIVTARSLTSKCLYSRSKWA